MTDKLKTFTLERKVDISGASGTGTVAWGVQFPNGKCALSWNTTPSSIAVYDSVTELEQIHGHNGATKVKWD